MVGSVRGSTHPGVGAWAPSGAQKSSGGSGARGPRTPGVAFGAHWSRRRHVQRPPARDHSRTLPPAFSGCGGRCCGRSPGITPRPRHRFRRPGVADHPETGHRRIPGHGRRPACSPLRPTHTPAVRRLPPPHSRRAHPPPHSRRPPLTLRPSPPASRLASRPLASRPPTSDRPAASIMRLTAHDVRFAPVNLMIDWEVGRRGLIRPQCRPRADVAGRWRAPREILVRNGPRKGGNIPRSPSACRGHHRHRRTSARARPGEPHQVRRTGHHGDLGRKRPSWGPKSSKISGGEPREVNKANITTGDHEVGGTS